MSKLQMQHGRYLATAFAAAMVMAAPMANASESWFPDLIFPETGSVPDKKAERTVTGSIPHAANRNKQTNRSSATRGEATRGGVSDVTEARQ
jgi:hypothetical protein